MDLVRGDFDGDLVPDVAVANGQPAFAGPALLRNQGDGTFLSGVTCATAFGPSSLATGDLDADGDVGLVTLDTLIDDIELKFNDGTDPPFVMMLGVLDASGRAVAQIALPPGAASGQAGLAVHHAFVAIGAGVGFASNAVALRFLK